MATSQSGLSSHEKDQNYAKETGPENDQGESFGVAERKAGQSEFVKGEPMKAFHSVSKILKRIGGACVACKAAKAIAGKLKKKRSP